MPESECGVRAPATVKVVHGGLELQRGAPVVHDGIVHAVEVRLNDEDQLVGDEQREHDRGRAVLSLRAVHKACASSLPRLLDEVRSRGGLPESLPQGGSTAKSPSKRPSPNPKRRAV